MILHIGEGEWEKDYKLNIYEFQTTNLQFTNQTLAGVKLTITIKMNYLRFSNCTLTAFKQNA